MWLFAGIISTKEDHELNGYQFIRKTGNKFIMSYFSLLNPELLWTTQRLGAFLTYQGIPTKRPKCSDISKKGAQNLYMKISASCFGRKEETYYASSGFLFLLELSYNSQGKLNVGINELIWRSLEIFRNLRKLCAMYSDKHASKRSSNFELEQFLEAWNQLSPAYSIDTKINWTD